VVATIVAGMIGLAVMPDYVRVRFFTIFSTDSEATKSLSTEESDQLNKADVNSTQARLSLLMDSIAITGEHPIFGVGMGQFPHQNYLRHQRLGDPGAAHVGVVTHNMYTQVASETGVLAMILFTAVLVQSFFLCGKIGQLSPALAPSAGGMRMAIVAFSITGFFLAVAYSQLFYITAAITARLYMTAEDLKRRQMAMGNAAVPSGQQGMPTPNPRRWGPAPGWTPARLPGAARPGANGPTGKSWPLPIQPQPGAATRLAGSMGRQAKPESI